MENRKNPLIAFLLAFIPGVGLMYLGKVLRGIRHSSIVINGSLPLSFFAADYIMSVPLAILSGRMWFSSLCDQYCEHSFISIKGIERDGKTTITNDETLSTERFYTIILSMIPGLGHFQLGLMNRGVTFLASFLGVAAMIIFVTAMTGRGEFHGLS